MYLYDIDLDDKRKFYQQKAKNIENVPVTKIPKYKSSGLIPRYNSSDPVPRYFTIYRFSRYFTMYRFDQTESLQMEKKKSPEYIKKSIEEERERRTRRGK